jgi:hypothetical protein
MNADLKPTPHERRSLLNGIRKRPPKYYQDDPEFFLEGEDADDGFPGMGFCPSLHSFELRFAKRGNLEILDQGTYGRLLREDASAESK